MRDRDQWRLVVEEAKAHPEHALFSSIVSVRTFSLSKALVSNGSCIFAYLEVVTQQRVYTCYRIFISSYHYH
jgi:hypothetical protein